MVAFAVPQIVVTVVDHESEPVRDIDRMKLGAQLHKQKCLPTRTSSFPVSQDSHFVFNIYHTDPVVPTTYEFFFFRVTVRELQAHELADTGAQC